MYGRCLCAGEVFQRWTIRLLAREAEDRIFFSLVSIVRFESVLG